MESLMYSDYYKPLVKESRIIPGLMVKDFAAGTLTCPKCGKQHGNIPHHQEHRCSCGLLMRRSGASLKISLE